MNATRHTTKPPSPYAVRARARRDEDLNVRETAEQVAGGRCKCGCGLPATVEGYAQTCLAAHKQAVRTAFEGL